MSWLEFVERMVSAVAWPIVALVALLYLRPEIKAAAQKFVERLGKIARLKAPGGVEMDFEKEVEEVKELAETTADTLKVGGQQVRGGQQVQAEQVQAEEVMLPPETLDQRFSRYKSLAPIDPSATFILSFSDLERLMRNEFELRYPNEAENWVELNTILDRFERDGTLPAQGADTLRRLLRLRNAAAQEPNNVNADNAKEYIDIIRKMIGALIPLFERKRSALLAPQAVPPDQPDQEGDQASA